MLMRCYAISCHDTVFRFMFCYVTVYFAVTLLYENSNNNNCNKNSSNDNSISSLPINLVVADYYG